MAGRAVLLSLLLATFSLASFVNATQVLSNANGVDACKALYQLDGMAQCVLGWSYNQYRTYGCSCSGLLSFISVDGIDKCCHEHSECFEKITDERGCQNSQAPFYCMYHYDCDKSHHKIACNDNKNSCERKVCECDSALVQCLKKFPEPDPMNPVSCHLLFGGGHGYSNAHVQGDETWARRIAP